MVQMENSAKLDIIGSTEFIKIAGIENVPAKIDTGADTSAVWASNINMGEDGVLTFSLFGEQSPFYTGERLETTDYKAKRVRSSHGDRQIRYRVKLPLTIGGKDIESSFTLANRSTQSFPILIGRHTIENKFLVDVSISSVDRKKPSNSLKLSQELKDNPYKFHQKYFNRKEAK